MPGSDGTATCRPGVHTIESRLLNVLRLSLQTRAALSAEEALTANTHRERLIGTIRRQRLDFLIPINERHLRRIVGEFEIHYNRGRPHSALGPGIPEPPQAKVPAGPHRHKFPAGYRVASTPGLGGLHHEYRPEKEAA